MTQKRGAELAVWLQQFQAFFEHALDPVFEFLALGKSLQNGLLAALLHLAVKSKDDGVLGRVVIVSATKRDPRFGRNVAHSGWFKSLFAEEFHRRLVNLAPGIFRARRGPVLGCRIHKVGFLFNVVLVIAGSLVYWAAPCSLRLDRLRVVVESKVRAQRYAVPQRSLPARSYSPIGIETAGSWTAPHRLAGPTASTADGSASQPSRGTPRARTEP